MTEWQLFPRWRGGHYPLIGYWSRNDVAGKLLVFSYVVLPRSPGDRTGASDRPGGAGT